jgi:Ca2+-binding RTX toxin-like protein
MTITKTFTDGADSYAVNGIDTYQLDFAGGNDVLRVVTGTVTAHMGLGDDFARVDGGAATIFGDDGADRVDLHGGSATASGGDGNDRFNIWGGANHVLDGGAGDDLFVSYGFANGLQLSGGDGNDRFYGFSSDGGAQVTLAGGSGNDIYRVLSNSGPTIVENPGEGTDTVQVAPGISYTLGANLETLRVLDTLGSGEDAMLTGNALANRIYGSSGRDTINGLAGNDYLVGGAGNDRIIGGDGNDRIIGGLGGDTMTGGAGNDLYVYTTISDSPFANGSYDAQDTITDWTTSDRIDLSAMDANSLLAGQQHFHFAGYGNAHPPTSHNAGDLWLGGFAGELWIQGFTDNDSTPDFLIWLFDATGRDTPSIDNVIL